MPHQLAGALMLVKDEFYYPILDGAARVRKLCLAVDADSSWQVGERAQVNEWSATDGGLMFPGADRAIAMSGHHHRGHDGDADE